MEWLPDEEALSATDDLVTAADVARYGASPARNAPPIPITTTNTTSVAAASPTASVVLEFVMNLTFLFSA
jgi:hypothetical protein